MHTYKLLRAIEIIKINDTFPKLSSGKIIEIHNVTNNKGFKDKPKLNITTKGLSRKQIIVPMSTNNSKAIITQANEHILNIKRLLKDVKSDVSVDFICSDNKGVITATPSDLSIVEKYVKELNNIN